MEIGKLILCIFCSIAVVFWLIMTIGEFIDEWKATAPTKSKSTNTSPKKPLNISSYKPENAPAFPHTNKSAVAKKKPAATAEKVDSNNLGSLNVNDPYEICRALACLATSIPYYRSDTACMMLVRIDNEKKETYISLNISEFSIDRTNISQYPILRIPEQIATLLSKVNFNDNGKGSWNITFNHSISERRAKEAIQAGISMVNGRPYICNLKSYFIGNNPSQIAIDYDAAD